MNSYFFHKQNYVKNRYKSTQIQYKIPKECLGEMIKIFSSLIQGRVFDSSPKNATALKLLRESFVGRYNHIRLEGLVSTNVLEE